jgi:hypothetical protein
MRPPNSRRSGAAPSRAGDEQAFTQARDAATDDHGFIGFNTPATAIPNYSAAVLIP